MTSFHHCRRQSLLLSFPFFLLMPFFSTVRQQFTLLMQVLHVSPACMSSSMTLLSRSLGLRPCKGAHTNLHERHSHQLCTLKRACLNRQPEKVKCVLPTLEYLLLMCVSLFSSLHLHPDLSRRKRSHGSVFPGQPGGADDPLWQAGEQEGDRLFVHLQGRPGCAAA